MSIEQFESTEVREEAFDGELQRIPIRHDLSNGRWYEFQGAFKPSSTTILNVLSKGSYFENWLKEKGYRADEIGQAAADRGTRMHFNIDSLVNGVSIYPEEMEMPMDEVKLLQGYVQWHKDIKPDIIGHEYCLWGDEPWCGTADNICIIDGKDLPKKIQKVLGMQKRLHLIDYKSGNHYPTHQLQLTSYGLLAKQVFAEQLMKLKQSRPIISVLRLYSFRTEKPRYDWKFYDYDIRGLRHAYNLWVKFNGTEPNLPPKLPEVITLEEKT